MLPIPFAIFDLFEFSNFLQLDTLLGRPSRRGGGSRGGINIPRPNSEGDFPEMEDQVWAIENLDDEALNHKLEELLVSFNTFD